MSYQPADRISRGALREEISNELSPQVQLEFPYGFMSQQVIVSSGAIGDVFTASGVAVCRTGNSANSYAKLISYQRARHQAGQGLRSYFDCTFTEGKAGSYQLVGVGDESEGIFFGYSGVSFGVINRLPIAIPVIGTNISFTPTSSWNQDKADGTGKLPAMDFTKGQSYKIETYPGIIGGGVRLSLLDPNDSEWVIVHKTTAVNALDKAIIQQLNWAAFMDVHNDTNDTNLEIQLGTHGIFLEGKEFNQKILRSIVIEDRFASKDTEELAWVLRNKDTINGITNRGLLHARNLTIFNNSVEPLKAKIGLVAEGGTSGTIFTEQAVNSLSEISTSGTLISLPQENLLGIYIIPGDSEKTITFTNDLVPLPPGASGMLTVEVGEGDTYSLTFTYEEWI